MDSYEEFMHHVRPTGTICISADDHIDASAYTFINKGEDKMKLLEIYEDKQTEKIYNEYSTKLEKIRATDPRYKEILDFKKKFEKEVVVYDDSYTFSDVIVRKGNDLLKQRQIALDVLRSTMREVNAQLELCETYEQKMAVLRSYNIVDENGVLVC